MVKLTVTPSVFTALQTAASFAADKQRETVLFTEDKCTVALERAVLSALPGKVSFHAEVVSFSRFFKKYGGQISALSKEGSSMLIRRILAESEGEFSLLPPVGGKKNMASALYDMLAQLKSACVNAEDLQRAAQGESGLFAKKLRDLALLSDKYAQALAQTGKTDQSGLMNLLPEFLLSTRILQGKRVILAGYASFTRQMQRVITALISSGAEVIAVLPAGTCMRAQSVESFRLAVKAAGETLTEEVLGAGESVADRLRPLLYSPESYAGEGALPVQKISVYRAENPEGEVERLALTVLARVREGARYRDFSVVSADAVSYLPLFIRIFKKYEIPVYTDVKYTLARHPLARFLVSALGVSAYGATYRTVSEVVNSAYFPHKEGVPAFLGYAKRAGAVGNRFYQPFALPLPNQEQAEKVRRAFADICPPLKERATAGEYLAFAENLLVKVNATEVSASLTERMRKEHPEIADFTRQAPERLAELLAETRQVLGNTALTVTEFCDVLSAGLQAVETSVLPTRIDAVTVSSPDKACVKNSKYVFALGMNSDFPAVTEDTAFLSERDLLELEEKGVSVDPNLQEMNERARAQAVYALTAFSESLVLSYPAVSFSGEANAESELITLVKRNCLVNGEGLKEVTEGELLKIEDSLPREKRLIRKANGYITAPSALERYFSGLGEYAEGGKEDLVEESGFYAFTAKKDQENGTAYADALSMESLPEGLRGSEEIGSITPGAISATAIQTYFACPYKYFLSKTLGVQEPQEMKIAANESGTLMHAVYEAFGREMKEREIKEEEIPALVKGFFEEVLARPDFVLKRGQVRNEVSFQRLLKEAERGCIALHGHFARSSLRISAVEKGLFEQFKDAPLAFTIKGREHPVPLTGVVDRIDENEEFFRIVDYKTGNVKCDLGELYTGRHLQLELYLLAVQNLLRKRPVGGYYFFSRDAYEETPTPIRLYGKTLNDDAALYAQDRGLEVKGDTPQESVVLPYTVSLTDKGKKFTGKNSSSLILSEEDFTAQVNYACSVAEQALNELESGFIYPTPYEGECEWCKFQSVCGRSKDFYGEGRKLTATVKKQTVVDAVILAKGEENAR